MKFDLFKISAFHRPISDWNEKKQKITSLINFHIMENVSNCFYSDRKSNQNSYRQGFAEIFRDELSLFAQEFELEQFNIGDVWTVKYLKDQFHPAHNHSSTGYSGIIYLDYNDREHRPTAFINPVNDPVRDRTPIKDDFFVMEGDIMIVPSSLLHFTYPNKSDSPRIIIGFDIKFDQ